MTRALVQESFDFLDFQKVGPDLVLNGETVAKEIGQQRAIDAGDEAYKIEFDSAIQYLAARAIDHRGNIDSLTFTIDDVISLIGLPNKGQNKNNLVGALMSRAAKQGLIRAVGYTESNRVGSHKRAVRLWKGNQNA